MSFHRLGSLYLWPVLLEAAADLATAEAPEGINGLEGRHGEPRLEALPPGPARRLARASVEADRGACQGCEVWCEA